VVTATAGIRGLFDGLVETEVADAYERLLASGGCPKNEAAAFAGGPAVLQALTSTGMARIQPHSPARPAWLRAASPDLALQGVLAARQHRLAKDTELVLHGQQRLAAAQARYGTPVTGAFPEHLVAVITDRQQIADLSASLANTARLDWMTIETFATEMPLTGDFAASVPPAAGLRRRSIYDATAMNDPVARRIIRRSTAAGEQARLLSGLPVKLQLADSTTVLLPLTPAGTGGALLIRAPVIVAAIRQYFELLWDRATPVPARRQPPAGSQDHLPPSLQIVLELMAEGLSDAAIATRAGISLTTVRRRIAAIMKRLDATTRFAAGAAAWRRGWLD
jgi:DNA-binding CsgD family transcriptional regulator